MGEQNFRVRKGLTVDGTGDSSIAGNLGIGTTSPSSLLHLHKNAYDYDDGVQDEDGDFHLLLKSSQSSNAGDALSIGFGQSGNAATVGAKISHVIEASYSRGALTFSTNNTAADGDTTEERMRITGAGNVGIGTTSPDAPLHVEHSSGLIAKFGEGNAETRVQFADARAMIGYHGDMAVIQGGSGGKGVSLNVNNGTFGSGVALRAKSDGKVGINTTTPENRFQVNHTGADGDNGMMIVRADTSTADGDLLGGIGFDSTDGNDPSSVLEASAGIAAYAAEDHGTGDKGGDLVFFTTAIDDNDDTTSHERMRIDSEGKVGIGTIAPEALLDVNTGSGIAIQMGADVNAATLTNDTRKYGRFATPHYHNAEEPIGLIVGDSDGTDNIVNVGGGSSAVNAATSIRFWSAANDATVTGTERMRIASDGKVGIGTTSPTQLLHLDHNATNPDADGDFGIKIDHDSTGSASTTGDREQGGLYVDADTSTTGGDTSNEHRLYGIWSDTRANSDSDPDAVYGVYSYAEDQRTGTSGMTNISAMAGVYGVAASDANNTVPTVSALYGLYGYVTVQDNGTVNNSHGVRGLLSINANRAQDTNNLRAVSGEIDIAGSRSGGNIDINWARVFEAVIDHNVGASQSTATIANGYLYYGDYAVSVSSEVTTKWGLYINDEDKNYISGNLGIGTTGPDAKLHVEGSVLIDAYNVGAGAGLFFREGHLNTNQPSITVIDHSGSNPDGLAISAYDGISFRLNAVEKARFDSNGHLGIGTDNPGTTLHLTSGSGYLKFETSGSVGEIKSDFNLDLYADDTDGNSDSYQNIRFFTAGANERMRVAHDGKVGIGEDDPASLLEIRGATTIGTTTGHIMLTGDSATNGQGPQIVFSESGSGSSYAGAYIGHARTGSNSMGDLIFATRATSGDANTVPTERLRILADGKVGIGDSSPATELEVNGTVTATGHRGFNPYFCDLSVTSGGSQDINAGVGSPSVIEWNNQATIQTDYFTHSTSSQTGRLYVDKDGMYAITFNINWDNTGSGRTNIVAQLFKNGSAIPRTKTTAYSRGSAYGDEMNSLNTFFTNLSANDYLQVKCWYDDRDQDAPVNTIEDQCFIQVLAWPDAGQ